MSLNDSDPGSSHLRSLEPDHIMAEQCTGHGLGGVAVAAAPRAALAGANTLQAGGNAYAAALTSALAETVLLPPKCGLAGDLIALAWEPGATEPEALLGIGGAPKGLARIAELGQLDSTGPFSIGVPGAPAGYLALAKRANMPLESIATPAIQLAEEGFCWSRICSVLADESQALVAKHNPAGTRYYPNGRAILPGSKTHLPGLARALRALVRDREGFLQGEVGKALVDRVAIAGGILRLEDMRFAQAQWARCDRLDVRSGLTLFATPAPTHGPSLLQAMQYILAENHRSSGQTVHQGIMRAIAKRREQLADPSGTSMVSAIDARGCMVVVIHSLSYPRFGSGLILDDYDLILSNRAGRGFSSQPGHPNFPTPGKRPASTLHAWGMLNNFGERLLGATPGGANQMPWNAQSLTRLVRGESDIGRVICAPRWQWVTEDDSLVVEEGFSEAEYLALQEAAPTVRNLPRWGLRSAMQILQAPGKELPFIAAVDPRTGGSVIAL